MDNTHENKSLNLPIGGIGNHVLELLPVYESIENLKISVITKYSEYKPTSDKVKIYSIYKFKNSKLNTINFNLKLLLTFLKIHKIDPIHIINIHSFYYNLITPLIIRTLYKIPILITTPTDFYTAQKEEFISKSHALLPKIFYYAWMKFFRTILVKRKSIYLQAINENIYQDFIDLNFTKENLVKVPNGISSKKYLEIVKEDSKEIIFGFLGRLIKSKNIRFMMNEFLDHLHEYPDDKLYIFGKGPEEKFINDFITEKKISKNVKYWGFLKDKLDIYRKINVLIHPSLGEGLPMTILEAVLTNTFVIASDVSGSRDIIEHLKTGLLFNPYKEGDLKEKLKTYRERQDLVSNIMESAKKKVMSEFEIEVEARKIYTFIKKKL